MKVPTETRVVRAPLARVTGTCEVPGVDTGNYKSSLCF